VAERLVPTQCSFCGVQCGMHLKVADGAVIGVEPRDFPHNRGSLCPKGVVAYQQVNHPDRLLHPLVRRGGKGGRLEQASWDEARDYVVGRWQALQAEHGRDAVAVYSGSSMTNEKCYLTGKFARVGLGTRHIDYTPHIAPIRDERPPRPKTHPSWRRVVGLTEPPRDSWRLWGALTWVESRS